MKKLFLSILVLGLLLSGNAYAANFPINYQSEHLIIIQSGTGKFKALMTSQSNKSDKIQSLYNNLITQAKRYCKSQGKEFFKFKNDNKKRFGAYDQRFICAENFVTIRELIGKGVYDYKDRGWFFTDQIYLDGLDSTSAKVETYPKASDNISKWYDINKPKFAKKPKKEKPKKKKPKQLPEDNKVVPAGSGSGFFVSNEGHVITNHHVIDGCNTTKVSFKGNQVDAQILAVDKMNDIAILKTNIKPNSIFPISNEDVSLLEDVVVAGYPLGRQVSSAIKTHKGVVTALAGAGDNYSNFQTDASINAGNSGGPIMNQKGNIVGIAVATWVEEGVQGVHFGIKSSTLKTFANSNSLKFSQANNRELSNKDLGKLITEATVYLECHMTVANIKKMMAAANNRKAFFSEFK